MSILSKGTMFRCSSCLKPILKLKEDVDSTDTFDCAKLEGIGLQPDPKPSDTAECAYCHENPLPLELED